MELNAIAIIGIIITTALISLYFSLKYLNKKYAVMYEQLDANTKQAHKTKSGVSHSISGIKNINTSIKSLSQNISQQTDILNKIASAVVVKAKPQTVLAKTQAKITQRISTVDKEVLLLKTIHELNGQASFKQLQDKKIMSVGTLSKYLRNAVNSGKLTHPKNKGAYHLVDSYKEAASQ